MNFLEPLLQELETRLRQIVREELHAQLQGRDDTAKEKVPSAYLTADEAAEVVGVQPATIRNWVATGKLKNHRAGRLLRVRREELERYLARGRENMDDTVDLDVRRRKALARLG